MASRNSGPRATWFSRESRRRWLTSVGDGRRLSSCRLASAKQVSLPSRSDADCERRAISGMFRSKAMSQSQNIFDKGDEPYGNATIGWAPDGWDLYVYGFRRAAEILLTHVEEKHTSLDVIVFPTVFLLRHHLELAIKLINRDARLLLDRPRPERAEHRLQVLWDQTKELIIEVVGVEPLGLGPI